MNIKEFTERTGFYPTYEHYKFIEKAYMDFDGDKDAFCKAYKANERGLASKIAFEASNSIENRADADRLASRVLEARLNAQQKENEELQAQIEKLKAQLDAELEWTLCKSAGTQMKQRDYVELRENGFTKVMTDEEAADYIAEELGFNVKRVKIIHTVETFEVNKHQRMRVAETYDREPLYSATDWNYVRFNVNGIEYEYIDGQLEMYCR